MAPGTFLHTRCVESRRALAREGSRRAFPALALLAVLLLAAPGAFAVQERVAPDALAADGCDWNNCTIAAVDDDPDGPDADWATAAGNNTSHFGHFAFATPTQPLDGVANQVFRAAVRKSVGNCGTGTPTARIELWEAGGSVRAGTEVSVTSASGQVISFTWTAGEITNAADVEVKVFGIKSGGSPDARCAVDLGAVEWNAEVTAAGSLPTLSSPTAPFATIDTTGATLGATIDTEGSSTITDYGTVWGTSPSPTGNAQSVGGTPPGPPHPFDDGGRTLSPPETPGTRIYYAGYATNGTGTGYSPDGSFYLEPNQVTSASISNVTSSGMRVSWTLPGTGAGDGTIVLMREGGAVDADPTDGTLYTASASWIAPGSEIGTGNYVVFQGSGTQVDVTDLTPSTAYFVRVYQYAGTTEPLVNYELDAAQTATDTTTGAGSLPTLSSPTVTAIGATSATLGARIDTEGSSTITDYGTVWGTSPSPTGNAQSVGGTPPGPPHPFDDGGRTDLPQGSLIYYAGYATNASGTGYSPDGSFYTDPESQASFVIFRGTALETELTFDWRAGSGDGVVVLMRLGTAVDDDPVDGVEYLDGSNVFAAGSEIGTGNYVVYVGAASAVTVTGLASDLTYHVAVYEYAG
ncbi:MAG: fibronectin type III domain-containing protein, partial [Planctomycetota bacterium]